MSFQATGRSQICKCVLILVYSSLYYLLVLVSLRQVTLSLLNNVVNLHSRTYEKLKNKCLNIHTYPLQPNSVLAGSKCLLKLANLYSFEWWQKQQISVVLAACKRGCPFTYFILKITTITVFFSVSKKYLRHYQKNLRLCCITICCITKYFFQLFCHL